MREDPSTCGYTAFHVHGALNISKTTWLDIVDGKDLRRSSERPARMLALRDKYGMELQTLEFLYDHACDMLVGRFGGRVSSNAPKCPCHHQASFFTGI